LYKLILDSASATVNGYKFALPIILVQLMPESADKGAN